jgi:hypothetical protein
MKKALNTDSIASELRDASPFFRRPAPSSPAPEPARSRKQQASNTQPSTAQVVPVNRTPERSNERTPEGASGSSTTRTVARRRARRVSYELYEDQIARIKSMALADQLNGGDLSQSAIVRTAIDRYFAESGKTE